MKYYPIETDQNKFLKDLEAMIFLLKNIEQPVARQAIKDLEKLKDSKRRSNV